MFTGIEVENTLTNNKYYKGMKAESQSEETNFSCSTKNIKAF